MSRPWSETMDDFRRYWKNFIWQSLLATGSIFLVLVILDMDEAVIVASLGATAFVVFALPEKMTAFPRNVIGGHLVGLLCGLAGVGILHLLPVTSNCFENAVYAFSVGLSIFVMTVSDTEHPPAAGTALGVAMKDFDPHVLLQVMLFAIIFSIIRFVLKKHLRDLAYLPKPPKNA